MTEIDFSEAFEEDTIEERDSKIKEIVNEFDWGDLISDEIALGGSVSGSWADVEITEEDADNILVSASVPFTHVQAGGCPDSPRTSKGTADVLIRISKSSLQGEVQTPDVTSAWGSDMY